MTCNGNDENKNCAMGPFERNRYFYGKLMTVRDFQTEQSYFNEKRHLLNRLIHGVGIVCGLEVKRIALTGQILKIDLSAGLALDCCGREIAVGEEMTEVLVSGQFPPDPNQPRYYLYLKYCEQPTEKVPSISNPSSCEEACCDNRIRENFQFELSLTPPSSNEIEWGKTVTREQLKAGIPCPGCQSSSDPKVLLAVLVKNEIWRIDEAVTREYRNLVFSNPELYELINGHLMDFGNPHGSLKRVNGVGNSNSQPFVDNIDLVSADHSVVISPDNINKRIDLSIAPPTQVTPVGPTGTLGDSKRFSPDDHAHRLDLAADGGLEFTDHGLRINGAVEGDLIDFSHPVWGQDPVEDRHLVTKQYVDSKIAGLDWQPSVKDKDLKAPPPGPASGDRYLLLAVALSGEWQNKSGNIATWSKNKWNYTAPNEGMAVFVEDENRAFIYADGKWVEFLAAPNVTAGDGLVSSGAVLSVGQGEGIMVNSDNVSVNFETQNPLPSASPHSPGKSDTVSRGDHVHPLPDMITTGVVVFESVPSGQEVVSDFIDADLGPGSLCVTLGIETSRFFPMPLPTITPEPIPTIGPFPGPLPTFGPIPTVGPLPTVGPIPGPLPFPTVGPGPLPTVGPFPTIGPTLGPIPTVGPFPPIHPGFNITTGDLPQIQLSAVIDPGLGRFKVHLTYYEQAVMTHVPAPKTIRVRWWAFKPVRDAGEVVVAGPTPAPTISPTIIPTFRPTINPTILPTFGPTLSPTILPTFGPTLSPTILPTFGPTLSPTILPTFGPTLSPTISPTIRPTIVPTFGPTINPTILPTFGPTLSPTIMPTFAPTFAPTIVPTFAPTVSPTILPTFGPTLSPVTPRGVALERNVSEVRGIGPVFAARLEENGISSLAELASTEVNRVATILEISEVRAMGLIDTARGMIKKGKKKK